MNMLVNGQKIDVPEREIHIYNLQLLKINKQEKLITFEIFCSKGTYIRSICEDIAEKLNTVGYMLDLCRTLVGEFSINNSISINELIENSNNIDFLNKNIISIEKFFGTKPKVVLNNRKLELFLNGVIIDDCNVLNDDIVRVYNENNIFIGVGHKSNAGIKRDIIVM